MKSKLSRLVRLIEDGARAQEVKHRRQVNDLDAELRNANQELIDAEQTIKVLETERARLNTALELAQRENLASRVERTQLIQERDDLRLQVGRHQDELALIAKALDDAGAMIEIGDHKATSAERIESLKRAKTYDMTAVDLLARNKQLKAEIVKIEAMLKQVEASESAWGRDALNAHQALDRAGTPPAVKVDDSLRATIAARIPLLVKDRDTWRAKHDAICSDELGIIIEALDKCNAPTLGGIGDLDPLTNEQRIFALYRDRMNQRDQALSRATKLDRALSNLSSCGLSAAIEAVKRAPVPRGVSPMEALDQTLERALDAAVTAACTRFEVVLEFKNVSCQPVAPVKVPT